MDEILHIDNCVKCGSKLVRMSYCTGDYHCRMRRPLPPYGMHMDCWCERCGYRWSQAPLDKREPAE